jgi:hypothetical protein
MGFIDPIVMASAVSSAAFPLDAAALPALLLALLGAAAVGIWWAGTSAPRRDEGRTEHPAAQPGCAVPHPAR